MTTIQKFFTKIFPARWGESMEAESREWMVRCPCGFEMSIWESGGIRWKASGEPRRLMMCRQCGETGWHSIYRR